MKRYLRDVPKSLLLIIGMAVLYFLLFNVMILIENIAQEERFNERFENSYSIKLELIFDNFDDDIAASYELIDMVLSLQDISNCNVYVTDVPVYCAREIKSRNSTIVLCVDDSLKMMGINGNHILTHSSDDCIILGKTLSDKLSVNVSDTLLINNVEAGVFEIKDVSSSGGIDNSIYFIWNNCTDEIKHILSENMYYAGVLNLTLESDKNIKNTVDSTVRLFEDFGCYVSFEDSTYNEDYENVWYRIYNELFLTISIAFSILSAILITELWLKGRKKELLIRRTYGYSKGQILKLLCMDYFKLSISSIFIAVVLQLIYSMVFDFEMISNIQSTYKFFVVMPVICFLNICVLLVSVIKNRTLNIAEEIRGE